MNTKSSLLQKHFGIFIHKIIEIIKNYDIHFRLRKASVEMCLEQTLKVLKQGISWCNIETNGLHFTTIYKRYLYWCKIGVFKLIWNYLMNLYTKKLLKNPTWFKVLFIDSSMIKNVKGIDCKGRNHFDRNRMATKMSIISDKNKIPLCATFYPANIHDAHTIEDTIKSIEHKIMVDKRNTYNLIGDKGYIINKDKIRLLHKNYRVNLITPLRKNQKAKLSKSHKHYLSQRITIEHLFCRLDHFKRIKFREEKYIEQYIQLTYLAFCLLVIEKL